MEMQTRKSRCTMYEIILVVGIFAIIASMALLSINPDARIIQERNDQRKTDLSNILEAMLQYSAKNNGQFPVALSSTDQQICKDKADWPKSKHCTCKGFLNLEMLTGAILPKIPSDPFLDDPGRSKYCGTWYLIRQDAKSNQIVATASGSLAEASDSGSSPQVISISR